MEGDVLVTAIKSECGKITSSEELHDDDILRQSEYILRRIDERITDRKLRSFDSIKDEREYDPHADTVRVQKVYPSDTSDSNTMTLGTHHKEVTDPEASEYYLFPSLYAIKMQRRIRGLAELKWEWNAIRRKIVIDPAPTIADLKYWYISVERVTWTLDNLPVDFEELLVVGIAWKCLEIVLLKRSDLGGIPREGGFVDYPASAMKGFIDSKKEEFFNILRLKAMIYGSK